MNIIDYGYDKYCQEKQIDDVSSKFEIGRVIEEQKGRYCVFTNKGEFHAKITGNMRFTAKSRSDYPAVGDWVLLSIYKDSSAVIASILPRYSVLKRKAVEHYGKTQIIATNIDYALVLQAADRDFNINRIERNLTICNEASVKPIIIITKIDLYSEEEIDNLKNMLQDRIKNTELIMLSNKTHCGLDAIDKIIQKRNTYCLLGSSGVGKSTLLNNLSNKKKVKTREISDKTNKGRHTTTYRELVILENSGIMIDNPGMRELGLFDAQNGLEVTFNQIMELANNCKFNNCSHVTEIGCAVLEALKNKTIEVEAYNNFLKMKSEKKHYESTKFEKHKKDKAFGKVIKRYKKNKKF